MRRWGQIETLGRLRHGHRREGGVSDDGNGSGDDPEKLAVVEGPGGHLLFLQMGVSKRRNGTGAATRLNVAATSVLGYGCACYGSSLQKSVKLWALTMNSLRWSVADGPARLARNWPTGSWLKPRGGSQPGPSTVPFSSSARLPENRDDCLALRLRRYCTPGAFAWCPNRYLAAIGKGQAHPLRHLLQCPMSHGTRAANTKGRGPRRKCWRDQSFQTSSSLPTRTRVKVASGTAPTRAWAFMEASLPASTRLIMRP